MESHDRPRLERTWHIKRERDYHLSVRLSDQKIPKLPRAAEVRCSDGSSASGNSKNSEESFGHKVGEQEITSRKDKLNSPPAKTTGSKPAGRT